MKKVGMIGCGNISQAYFNAAKELNDIEIVACADINMKAAKAKAAILDVRPEDYFAGRKSDEARAGHIPGAVNRPYTADLVAGTETWMDADTLKAAYAALGLDPARPVIVHCRTGHQASQTYFLLKHVMGYREVRWMDASWLAWAAREDLPVALD